MNLLKILLPLLLINVSCNDSGCCAKPQNNGQVSQAKIKNTQKSYGYDIGDIATDFKLKNIDGKMVSLADYKDAKGFIVVFTATHCPFSKAYEDRIVALDKKYKSKGYPVIAINPTNPEKYEADSYENMQILAKKKGFTFPFLLDVGQKIFPQYGATNTPHFFVLENTSQGNKVAYIGAMDDNAQDPSGVTKRYVEDAVDALIAGKKPKITKTKAIGCGIIR
ncbi:Putative peroxiredoxin [Polaribacter huanghezhanensis]|uniref:thioredoxin family protein n=1 Tax=Polaribacter huanghezhanensis TaxID=1354726 RepID=UPI0026483EBF|nr:thioredoxin family protein [Polaribacter huanghezhanensis]WKD85867.1 Putative peroxiredoxin [Polaribacter huanghezhanensis]